MALQKTPLAIQFAAGVDTKTDAKLVAPTKLIDLQNAVFLKNGALSKRNGYRALGKTVDETGLPYANWEGLAARGDELVLFANAKSYSYRPASDTWQTIGPVSSIVASADPIARTGTTQTAQDIATNGDVTVCAWEDSRGGVWASAIQASSKRVLLVPTQLDASGSRPRCVAVGTVLHVIWVRGPALWIVVLNPAAPTSFTAATVLTNDLVAANPSYDAVATLNAFSTSIQPGLIAWAASGSGVGYRVGYLHPSGVLGSPVTGLPSVATISTTVNGAVAVAYDIAKGDDLAVGWIVGNSFDVNFHDSLLVNAPVSVTPASSASASQVRIAMEFGALDGALGTLWYAVEETGATSDVNLIQTGAVRTDGSVKQASQMIRGHCLAARAFNDNGDVFCGVVHAVLFFPYVALLQLSTTTPAVQARLLPGLTSGVPTRGMLPSAVPLHPELSATGSTSRQHAIPLGYRIQLSGSSGSQFGESGIQLFTLDFSHADSFHAVQLGRGLYLAGALIQSYDGSRWAEHNFHCAPDTSTGILGIAQAAGGALTALAAYAYRVIYEEIDAQGELHPGPSSVTQLIVLTGANAKVTLTIPTYRLTSKKRVRIGVFRSLANATGTQIPYYRVSSVDPTNAGPSNTYLLNDPTVDSLSFVDTMADATLATLEPLYTNGGILSNDPEPSGGVSIVGGKTRLFWLDPLDSQRVNYSQALRDDTAAEMSAGLSIKLDPFGGDIVALAVEDDNVIVLKESAVFVFGGPGPDADGGVLNPSNAWTPPQLVTTDVGCSSPGSVANVPDGVAFQSSKGPVLLGRDLQIKSIGDDVFAYRAQHISRATLLPDRPHIVFLTDVDQGRTLLFDYNRGAWSTFTNHVGIDALVLNGSYYYLSTDGAVYVETPGTYRDGTRHIKRIVETSWIKFSGYLQGWQRILYAIVLGAYYSRHQLVVSYRLDYQDGYTVLPSVDVNSVYNPSQYGVGNYGVGNYGGTIEANTVYQEEFHINRRCQAISFKIEDAEDAADYGAAFDLSELLLIGGVLGEKFMPGTARSQ